MTGKWSVAIAARAEVIPAGGAIGGQPNDREVDHGEESESEESEKIQEDEKGRPGAEKEPGQGRGQEAYGEENRQESRQEGRKSQIFGE
jgi:hypothetical protein